MIFYWTLLAGLFFLPLVYWPWAPIPFEIPKVWFVNRWIEALGIIFLVDLILRPKKIEIDKKLIYLILIFTFVAIISSLYGVDFPKSLVGNYYRGDGLITFLHLITFSFIVAFSYRGSFQKGIVMAITSGTIIALILSISDGVKLYLFQDLSIDIWKNKSIGIMFGNPNFFAGFLVVILPFFYYQLINLKNSLRKIIWVFVFLCLITAILLTRSWGGLFGLGFFTLFVISLNKLRLKWFLLFCGLLIFFISEVFYLKQLDPRFVAEGRSRIFHKILLGVKIRPLFGYGWSNVDYAFEKVDWPVAIKHDVYVDKAHSMLLEILATCGIVGLMIYLMIIFRVRILLLKKMKNSKNKLWFTTLYFSFILYMLHSQTNIISISEEVIFWLILGISSSGKLDNEINHARLASRKT